MNCYALMPNQPLRRPTPLRMLLRLVMARSQRRAAATAEVLDRIVDRDLVLVQALPVHDRARSVERLAALIMLAQDYRHYATGWIGRRELRRRNRATFDQLTAYLANS
jgi:hypothetical protein